MNPDTAAVVLAAITGIPSAWAVVTAWRARRDARTVTATEFGTTMAKEAFTSVTEQVQRLEKGRTVAEAERVALTGRIEHLTDLLQITNAYLVTLLQLLDAHGITRPPAPSGLLTVAADHHRGDT